MTILDVFKSRIQESEKILITTHEYPDADGIGSEISLCLALKEIGKSAYCVNEEPLLDRYNYLDQDSVVMGLTDFQQKHPQFIPDLVIVVDTNTKERVGSHIKSYINQFENFLFIDHHPCRGRNLKTHCIDETAAATGQLVGEMIEHLGIPFTKKIALPIYTAIIIDTSSFRYPTVTGKTHHLIAKLMDTGINPPEAYNGIYGTKRIHHMHLLGRVLASAKTNADESIAWISLSQNDLQHFHSDVEDTHAFINHLLVLNNLKVACMFRDDGQSVKVSLRSTGDIDVGLMATKIGGGGHCHSAATIINKNGKNTEEITNEVIAKVQEMIDQSA